MLDNLKNKDELDDVLNIIDQIESSKNSLK